MVLEEVQGGDTVTVTQTYHHETSIDRTEYSSPLYREVRALHHQIEGPIIQLSSTTQSIDPSLARITLLEGDEAGAVGGTQSWLSVSGGNVGHGELGEVVAGHLGPDLDGVEDLSVVDGNDRADHLGHNDHVW